ncbi:GNAT family N-acetyltransferase [Phycicoccus sp. HDW14]|uniref:GNAT family N-acetyltransferase n=1 Tax=Phycicoccus sp. HDW14 TaxID=2714941 RepID=UPI00140ADC2D|nr:GNAT family protein [Phycicoccus sp. HDW14]QIM20852.1 GNAT family N-acetyltransferase [Phycicoccus sp. HDW14]
MPTRLAVSLPRRSGDLLVREFGPEDVDAYLAWRTDPRVTRWLLTTRADEATERLEAAEADPAGVSVAGVVDGRLVASGYLGVKDGMGQDVGDAWVGALGRVGYLVDPEWHGRGVGTRLLGVLLEVAFADLGMHRVLAGCFADNVASWRTMERHGMRREQHGVEDSWHAELGWVDGYEYAILRSEWKARRGG